MNELNEADFDDKIKYFEHKLLISSQKNIEKKSDLLLLTKMDSEMCISLLKEIKLRMDFQRKSKALLRKDTKSIDWLKEINLFEVQTNEKGEKKIRKTLSRLKNTIEFYRILFRKSTDIDKNNPTDLIGNKVSLGKPVEEEGNLILYPFNTVYKRLVNKKDLENKSLGEILDDIDKLDEIEEDRDDDLPERKNQTQEILKSNRGACVDISQFNLNNCLLF